MMILFISKHITMRYLVYNRLNKTVLSSLQSDFNRIEEIYS